MTEPKRMTKGERDDLLRLVRQRERVLKSAAEQRAAAMLSDFETQMAKIYKFNDEKIWKEAYEKAQIAVEACQREIAERCEELGVPPDYAPALSFGWYGRGENAVMQRQAELRRAAKAQIAAAEQTARVEIERLSVQAQAEIIASGLESEAARAFFDRMPSVEALIPALDPALLDEQTAKRRLN